MRVGIRPAADEAQSRAGHLRGFDGLVGREARSSTKLGCFQRGIVRISFQNGDWKIEHSLHAIASQYQAMVMQD